ncbi:hypothetical protein EO98_04310 [Methanosarcina sp. 2.H.T.1A.6]|uniref:ATP-dependent nuclease n=1 Tax=unclassified Methanosarcina TaxID=2644672 RepID=UPI0006213A70|nr:MULTISPECIES: AAA family ATPase [unclassified Methanosarcina]KKG11057.1 hypothetical protein EO97_07335 [Methanosarcina sp. 2.H.T.1A.15]KKG16328.1 hypothetical protein EO94_13475 [Methanosarcina sp. 2.H.T.1A.3]KKG19496.1 hypothetical protein EO98_04310 [Methanosarcina sp. 2.H.T.1A.6]KKG21801.1 hypothetical protein EO96_10330 [Methanosarcina sp. 2.H.T.1A.8]
MYISILNIKGFRFFNDGFRLSLNKGLTVLVGENGSGKSTVIDAIRLLLGEDEYNRSGISLNDFHRPFSIESATPVANILIDCIFDELEGPEQIAYLPWLKPSNVNQAELHLEAINKEDARGRIRKNMWGGTSRRGIFEWELVNSINCVYLPPLRDAEEKLNSYRGSRLARLLTSLNGSGDEDKRLEEKVKEQNNELLSDPLIQNANGLIKKCLIDSVGEILGQDVSIQFSEVNFNKIIHQLRLLFFPEIKEGEIPRESFRDISENSLGYNNLLYMATIIAEMEAKSDVSTTSLKVLLIEEPEAHLHPQLQTRLLQYLQSAAEKNNIQVIITTHSPTIAAAVGLDPVVVMSLSPLSREREAIALTNCCLDRKTKFFLERWIDITKSVLLFSKGVILVEGISEAILFPEFVKKILGQKTLEDYGISVINIEGIYFKYFMQLFCGYKISEGNFEPCDNIPIRCVGITDCDPEGDNLGTSDSQSTEDCNNPQRYLVCELREHTTNCRLYINSKTFEYDLALEGNNLAIMSSVLENITETNGPIKKRAGQSKNIDWRTKEKKQKTDEALWFLNHVDQKKGEFAQELAMLLKSDDKPDFEVPSYIRDAILYVTGKSN